MGEKYYRFMKEVPLKEVVYGAEVCRGSFFASDYLISSIEGKSLRPFRPTNTMYFAGTMVSYKYFEELLKDGLLVEVPDNLRELDWKYQTEIHDLIWHCDRAYESLCCAERLGNGVLIGIWRDSYDSLCKELDKVRDSLNDRVVKPLIELDAKLVDAAERSVDTTSRDGKMTEYSMD